MWLDDILHKNDKAKPIQISLYRLVFIFSRFLEVRLILLHRELI